MKKVLFFVLLLMCFLATAQDRYVKVSDGVASGNAFTEGTAWTLNYAVARYNSGAILPGEILWVKAGNYGDTKLIFSKHWTAGNFVKVKGYKTTIGDLDTTTGPRFSYGDTFSNTDMPTITNAGDGRTDEGVWLRGNYQWFENFQIVGYKNNLHSYATTGVVIKNIFSKDAGVQESDISGGKGIIGQGNNWLIENCFDLNSTAQGITFDNQTNGIIRNSKIYNDNFINPGGYYLLVDKSNNNLIEGCTVWRKPGLSHGGHGLIIKNIAKYNTFRNCVVYNSGIELNFSEVQYNLFENIQIFGSASINSVGDYSQTIRVGGGASYNTFRNIYMEDVSYIFRFMQNIDGPNPTPPSTNANWAGSYNLYENIVVNKAYTFFNSKNQSFETQASDGNKFHNISVYNLTSSTFIRVTHSMTNTEFKNVVIHGAPNATNFFTAGSGNTFTYTMANCHFNNVGFSNPSLGTSTTNGDPLFVNAASGDFNLQSGSPLIDTGTAISGLSFDFNNDARVVGGTIDRGAIEYQGAGGPPTDVTAPTVTSQSILNTTETTFRLSWTLDEPSKGWVVYGTASDTSVPYVYDYETTHENNFYTTHVQTVGGNNAPLLDPGTLYYYRYYLEDAAGNIGYSAEYSDTTLGVNPPDEFPYPILDTRAKWLKSKKLF